MAIPTPMELKEFYNDIFTKEVAPLNQVMRRIGFDTLRVAADIANRKVTIKSLSLPCYSLSSEVGRLLSDPEVFENANNILRYQGYQYKLDRQGMAVYLKIDENPPSLANTPHPNTHTFSATLNDLRKEEQWAAQEHSPEYEAEELLLWELATSPKEVRYVSAYHRLGRLLMDPDVFESISKKAADAGWQVERNILRFKVYPSPVQ